MTYRVGELDQRITIKRAVNTADDMGGNVKTFEDYAKAWALVRPESGGESTEFDRINSTASYLFVIRNGLQLLSSDIIEWDGDLYNIKLPKQGTKRRLYLEIKAVKGVAQ